MKNKINKLFIGVLIAIILLILLFSRVFGLLHFNDVLHGSWFSRFEFWMVLILLLIYNKVFERGDFLLFKEEKKKFLFYILSIIFLFFIVSAFSIPVSFLLRKVTNIEKYKTTLDFVRKNKLLLIFTCVTAGITEELIYRGYLQSRLKLLLNNWSSIILTSIIFALSHIGWGQAINVIIPFIIGIIFSIHYSKYRSLTTLIIFHFLFDFIQVYPFG